MEGSCPRCRTRLELPASGAYQCERCRCRFDVALGSGVNPFLPPNPAYASPGGYAGLSPYAPPIDPGGYGGPPAAAQYPPPSGIPGAAAAPEPNLGAPCAGHPENPATRSCERCGDFMCRLCATPVEGRVYCPKCFDLMHHRGSFGFTQRSFNDPALTLAVGILALLTTFIFPIAMLISILGIVMGIRTLRTHGQRPDLPGRGMTFGGMFFCGLALVLSSTWGFWIIYQAVKSS